MSDYRDDRQALKQRLEELEAELAELRDAKTELEAAQARLTELERENFELSTQLELAKKPKLPMRPETRVQVGIALAIGLSLALISAIMVLQPKRAPASRSPVTATRAAAAKPTTRPKPAAPGPQFSVSCRCPDSQAALGYTLGAVMSFGAQSTYMLSYLLRLPGDAGARDLPLSADVQTVPPPKLEGGHVEMLMACLPDRVVFALDQHVTAWSLESGEALWSATLPAPVGSAKSGGLELGCKPLTVKAGNVIIPHAGGSSSLRVKDGTPAGARR